MNDIEANRPTSHAAFPIGGVISITVPICGMGAALVLVASASRGTGWERAGPGILIDSVMIVGISGLLGATAALRAMVRKEIWLGLAQVGLILNIIILAIGCRVLVSLHH
jgi:hypothetical protein